MTPFETLIDERHDEMFRYIWRMLYNAGRDPTASADLTQDVFERAYRAYNRLRPDSNERAWLYKIATNCTFTALRRGTRQKQYSMQLPDDDQWGPIDSEPGPAQTLIQRELLDQVQHQIADLPPQQRGALILRYLHELNYTEIAEALNCSEDSARANVYQALKRLRNELANEGENEQNE